MNPIKKYLADKFRIDYDKLTPVKQHAFKAFDTFNSIAQSEIKSRLMQETFDLCKSWIGKKLLEKPEQEIKEKMFLVYKDMSPLFKDVEISIEAQASEALGSVKIPRIGELGKKIDLVDIGNRTQAIKLMKELMKNA